MVLAGAFAAEMSFLVGLPILTLGSDYFGIATLGFSIVLQTLMVNSDTILPFPEMKGGRGMIGIPKLVNQDTWVFAFVFLVGVIVVMRNLIRSSTGRTVMAVREDEVASKAMGVDVAGTKLLAFVIGSLFAGIGGAVYAHWAGFLSPNTFSFLKGFDPLIIVVFGGLGSMTGTIAASFGWIFFLEGFLRVLLVEARHRGTHVAVRALPHHAAARDAAAAAGAAGHRRVGVPESPARPPSRAARRRRREAPEMAAHDATGPILAIDGLTKFFGGLCAVKDFGLELPRGALWGLIGPNGAGKTTVFNLVTGLYPPSGGNVTFEGERITGLAPHEITRLGIARTFQNIRLFTNLSVLDNVRIAYHPHAGYNLSESILQDAAGSRPASGS